MVEERDTLLVWFLFLNSACLADGGGNIDFVLVAPGELEGGKHQVVMMKRDKGRLWSESFWAGYNVQGGGGCEVVFSERGKKWCKRSWLRALVHMISYD